MKSIPSMRNSGLHRLFTLFAVLGLVAVCGLTPDLLAQGDRREGAKPKTQESPKLTDKQRRERLEFRQQRTRSSMQELEDRIFQLSELLREIEPEHAARLVLGLQKSREDLIVDDMAEVSRLIKEGKLDAAEERQRRVVFRLNELRDLLLSTDLDLLLKLQRLRKMNKVLKKIEKLDEEQQRITESIEELEAKENPGKEEKAKAKRLARQQAKNRKLSDLARDELNDVADSEMESPKKLEEASKEMKAAEKKLKKGETGDAKKSTDKVQESVDDAQEDLRKAREKVLEELQPYIRSAIIETLLTMIERQQLLNEELAFRTGKKKPDPRQRGKRKALSDLQMTDGAREIQTLAKNAIQLLEETEYAAALPWAMRYVQEWAAPNVASFASASFGAAEAARGAKVEKDAEELVQILVEESRFAKDNADKPEALKVIKLLAELRTLRLLQDRVQGDTALADRGKAAGLTPAEQKILRDISGLRDWEAVIRDVTREIEKRGGSEYLKDDNDEESLEDDEFF